METIIQWVLAIHSIRYNKSFLVLVKRMRFAELALLIKLIREHAVRFISSEFFFTSVFRFFDIIYFMTNDL